MTDDLDAMRARRVTLPDGRYMIFYTFGTDAPQAAETILNDLQTVAADTMSAPNAQPEATEEANV